MVPLIAPKQKTRFPGQGKRDIAHERGGWVAAKIHIAATAGNLGPRSRYVSIFLERQRTFVPAGTLGSTLIRLGSPSIDAASTMPFDSTPINVAGCRFATITTFRPTSSSGVYFVPMPATIVRSP